MAAPLLRAGDLRQEVGHLLTGPVRGRRLVPVQPSMPEVWLLDQDGRQRLLGTGSEQGPAVVWVDEPVLKTVDQQGGAEVGTAMKRRPLLG